MVSAPSYGPLLLGRAITGIGVGLGLAIDPLYISEIAPKQFRGRLVTASEISINIGVSSGFVANFAFSGLATSSSRWRLMLGLGLLCPAIMVLLSITLMPESPRWLVARGRTKEAAATLAALHGGDEVEATMADIVAAVEQERSIAVQGWRPILRPSRGVQRALIVGVGIAAAQRAMGLEAVLFYFPRILDEAGVTSTTQAFAFLMVMGAIKTAFVFVSAVFLDRSGRRPMLLIGVFGLGVSLCWLAGTFLGGSTSPASAIGAIYVYMASFSLGVGPGCWLVVSEIFPLHVRAKGMAVCTVANCVVGTIVATTFLSLVSAMSYPGYFFMATAVAAAVWLFVYLCLPETKGRTLEEMERHFEAAAWSVPCCGQIRQTPAGSDVASPRPGTENVVVTALAL